MATPYWCDTCNRQLLETQVEEVRSGTGFLPVCPTCHRAVHPDGGRDAGAAPPDLGRVVASFPTTLLGAFAYPFRPWSLGLTAALVLLTSFVAFVPIVGFLLVAILQITYLFNIVRTTAAGEDDMTVALDSGNDMLDWLAPLVRYTLALVVAFTPAFLVFGLTRSTPLAVGVGVLGALYLPAALITAAHGSGCLGPINPIPAAQIIARIPGPYLLTVAFLGVAGALAFGLRIASDKLVAVVPIPFIPALLAGVVQLLAPVAMARLLGLLVREHGEEL